ncbi:MAG TPA: MFS transporter [Hyphomicrobiaceae bacterium]|nr:MFS transporter [Hyphomicrobiaceae bacterium]
MPRPPRPQTGLFVIGLGTIAAPLDTAVNIAMPSITAAFALALEDIRWIVIAYVLTYSSLMLVFGRLGDLLGYRPIFQLGLLVSALGFAACAAAPTYPLVLLGRVLQGIGTALALSCGPALATSLFDEGERARALAFYAGATAVGSALGPLAGGLLVERWGWSAVFAFRVPVVALALALSWRLPGVERRGSMRGFDAIGAALLVSWMSALLLGLAVLPAGLGPLLPLGLGLVALVLLAAFLVHETSSPQPLIRLGLFRNVDFAVMNAASIAVHFAAFAILILVPYYLVRTAGLEATAGGAMLALGALGTVAGSWATGRLARRISTGRLALAGIVLAIAGLGSVAAWTEAAPMAVIALSLLAQGFGLGLFQVAYADFVTATLPVADRGVAGSLTMVTRTIGVVAGATGLSAALTHFEAAALAAGAGAAEAFLAGFRTTFIAVAAALAGLLALSLAHPRVWLGPGNRQ